MIPRRERRRKNQLRPQFRKVTHFWLCLLETQVLGGHSARQLFVIVTTRIQNCSSLVHWFIGSLVPTRQMFHFGDNINKRGRMYGIVSSVSRL